MSFIKKLFGNAAPTKSSEEALAMIDKIQADKIAESPECIIFGGVEELNGYLFLETLILSTMSLKTKSGVNLTFQGDSEVKLPSDTQEVESEFSKVYQRYMSRISFDISEEEIKAIRANNFEEVVFQYKKKALKLAPLVNNKDNS